MPLPETAQARIRALLSQLCVELGLCLPPAKHDELVASPPLDGRSFAERVLRAEGLDPDAQLELLDQVLSRVAPVFEVVRTLRVTWPDGRIVADVEVSPTCDPLRTSHVTGTFIPGVGLASLAPRLDEVRRAVGAAEWERAARGSEAMDELGLVATDELGRVYEVFNVVFDGLLFSVRRAHD